MVNEQFPAGVRVRLTANGVAMIREYIGHEPTEDEKVGTVLNDPESLFVRVEMDAVEWKGLYAGFPMVSDEIELVAEDEETNADEHE